MAKRRNASERPIGQCVICASPFVRDRPHKKTCGPLCAEEQGRRRSCDYQRRTRAACPPPRKVFKPKACGWCGKEFIPSSSVQAFCRRECNRKHIRSVRPSRAILSPVLATTTRQCGECGGSFVPARYQSSYCSKACRRALKQRVAVMAYQGPRQQQPRRRCAECAEEFSPRDDRQRCCTVKCSGALWSRITARTRRARKARVAVEDVDPLKVLERDGWRCQICGIDTPRSLRGTQSPRAPEVDHIRPIAKGGEHSYANTQCACKRCNMAKGARWPDDASLAA